MIVINIEENNSIDVSVIVITYNQSQYIRQALDSILMQKVNFKYEILVGDDASTDGTQEILSEYSMKNPNLFKIVFRKENVGATKNIYELLVKARGKYIATLEGDDYWSDYNKLQEQYELLETNKEFIGCTHRFTIVNHKNNPIKKQKLNWVKQKDIFTIDDFKGIVLPGQLSTWFFRNIFKKNKYELISEVHRLISDRSIMMVILFNGNFKLIDKDMGAYRSFVELGNKTKCTNILYQKNDNKIKQEIEITRKNENISFKYFNKKYKFLQYRRQIFCDSIIMFLRAPCKDKLYDIYNAWNYTENKVVSILYLPIDLLKKIYYKFR